MRLRDSPILYLAILSLLFKFTWFLIWLQIGIYIFSLGTIELSLTFYLSCIILFLCEEYVISLLEAVKFNFEEHLNELDP